MFRLQQIDHVAVTVRDVETSVRWYTDVLGLQRVHEHVWGNCPAVVAIGGTSLALFPVRSEAPGGPPGPEMICVRHIAFRTDRENFDLARRSLAARGLEVELEDHEIAHSIYIVDPDGHQLEITTYNL